LKPTIMICEQEEDPKLQTGGAWSGLQGPRSGCCSGRALRGAGAVRGAYEKRETTHRKVLKPGNALDLIGVQMKLSKRGAGVLLVNMRHVSRQGTREPSPSITETCVSQIHSDVRCGHPSNPLILLTTYGG
jgi:hypothetical protein